MSSNLPLMIFAAFGAIVLLYKLLPIRRASKDELVPLLDKAEIQISKLIGGYSGDYLSAADFHKDLKEAIDKYKSGDDSKLDLFYIWFAPTSHWDDFTGENGMKLGDKVFKYVSQIREQTQN